MKDKQSFEQSQLSCNLPLSDSFDVLKASGCLPRLCLRRRFCLLLSLSLIVQRRKVTFLPLQLGCKVPQVWARSSDNGFSLRFLPHCQILFGAIGLGCISFSIIAWVLYDLGVGKPFKKSI